MPAPLAGVIATAAAPVVGGFMDSIFGNKQNQQLLREQQNWNLEQWHRQNAYNAPIAQMQRLKEAGLNPRLMYGKGAGSSNAGAVAPATPQRPVSMDLGKNMGSAMGTFLQAQHMSSQSELTKASTEEVHQRIAESRARVIAQNFKNLQESYNTPFYEQLAQNQRALLNAQTQDAQNKANMSGTQAKYQEQIIQADLADRQERGEMHRLKMEAQKFDNIFKRETAKLAIEGVTWSDEVMLRDPNIRTMYKNILGWIEKGGFADTWNKISSYTGKKKEEAVTVFNALMNAYKSLPF